MAHSHHTAARACNRPDEATLDTQRRRALAHHRASVIRSTVRRASSGERHTVYLLPPAPCRRLSSVAWRKVVRELPLGPPAARLRVLTRHARELLDSSPLGQSSASAATHKCCTHASAPPRILRVVLSIAKPLLLLLVNGALLRGNGSDGVAGLGALLAGCAVASAALDEQLIRRANISSSLAASLRVSPRASLASSLGLAEVLRFPLLVESVWSGAAQAVRAARSRPAAVFALAAFLGWVVSPLVFPPLLLAAALPLVGHAFAPAQPRLAAALKPCALLSVVLVVVAIALSSFEAAASSARPADAPDVVLLLGLAAGVLLPTAVAQLLFVQIADSLTDQRHAEQNVFLEGSSAPPEEAHREWRSLCLLVHLLGEPPSKLGGPEADALDWLLDGELEAAM